MGEHTKEPHEYINDLHDQIDEKGAEIAALQAENAALKEVAKYSQHTFSCNRFLLSEESLFNCSCGLSDALKAAEGKA